MKSTLIAIIMALPTACFCQYTYTNLQVNFLEDAAKAKNYTYENLRLYPIYARPGFSNTFKNVGKYMPLQEALQKKKIRITEKKDGGEVNNLVIENISADTIIVICGDIVKGGKQDRIVEQDIVLTPKSGKKEMKVFCVESGRWSSENQTTNNRQAVRYNSPVKKDEAAFNGTFNKGSMGLRKVVEKEKNQSKVWSKVEEINNDNKTSTATKTYTALSNSSNYSKKLDAYLRFFRDKFIADKSVIGVVVVSGNRVLGCDMFATNDLFRSQYQSLLHSYATEAILKGKPVTANPPVVKGYMDKLLANENMQQVTLKQKGNAFVDKGRKLRVSSFD